MRPRREGGLLLEAVYEGERPQHAARRRRVLATEPRGLNLVWQLASRWGAASGDDAEVVASVGRGVVIPRLSAWSAPSWPSSMTSGPKRR